MKKETSEERLKRLKGYVSEARYASKDWRSESWRDCEMWDGSHWTEEDWNSAIESGIEPVTANRTFSAVNLILGMQATNQLDIIAKGRTKDDTETGQVMTEALKFVFDQSDAPSIIAAAFKDQIIPGIGFATTPFSQDPREETVKVQYGDWKEICWDPFSSPWFSPERTRYVFKQRWVDIEDLIALFPEKRKEIEGQYDKLAQTVVDKGEDGQNYQDEAQLVEEEIRELSATNWIDMKRKRVRPVEIWYPENTIAVFALFPDGRYFEISDKMDPRQQYQIIQSSQQVVPASVKKMKVSTFFYDVVLQDDIPSPYPHNQYPIVPFVGYLDRWGFPFGVPRQIRGQNIEVNKRRSMALALLRSRRVAIERSAAPGGDNNALQQLYEEANKLDGFMVLEDGGLSKLKIQEFTDLSAPQLNLMLQSEREIQEVSGANAALSGLETNVVSSVALEKVISQGSTVLSPQFVINYQRSLKMLGEQLASNIQGTWKAEKVLRVTDRLTGVTRYVEVNKPVFNGQAYEIKNNITQGRYDIVISQAPQSDTVREQNLNMIIEWVKKSPPEAIPQLMLLAFELSNLPNKEQLLARIRPMLGMDPSEEKMTPEEVKEKVQKELEARQQQQAMMQQIQMTDIELELNKKRLENEKIKAQIEKIRSDIETKTMGALTGAGRLELARDQANVDAFKKGADVTREQALTELEAMKASADIQDRRDRAQVEAFKTGAGIGNQQVQNRMSMERMRQDTARSAKEESKQ